MTKIIKNQQLAMWLMAIREASNGYLANLLRWKIARWICTLYPRC
jgi:hypothetical protein